MTENDGQMSSALHKNIFIRIPGGFGDNLMATSVISAIAQEHPCWRIYVATRHKDIFRNNPNVTDCCHATKLKKTNPSFYEKFTPLTYSNYLEIRTTKSQKHYIDYFYDSLPFSLQNRIYQPQIFLTSREKKYKWRKLQKLPRPIVAISPHGGTNSKIPNKFYPAGKWLAVTDGLCRNGFTILQLGRKKHGPLLPNCLDWREIGYRKTAATLLHCDMLITHPSGFMHLATALSIPSMTLFGGVEDPTVGGYKHNPNLAVELECAPCWLEKPCDNPRCREILSPETIVTEAVKFVKPNTISQRTQKL